MNVRQWAIDRTKHVGQRDVGSWPREREPTVGTALRSHKLGTLQVPSDVEQVLQRDVLALRDRISLHDSARPRRQFTRREFDHRPNGVVDSLRDAHCRNGIAHLRRKEVVSRLAQSRTRRRSTSWAIVATCVPSMLSTSPVTKPRPPLRPCERVSNQCH